MAQPKDIKANQIRRVITRLFARDGYHGTSMRAIARELGMHPSSLYHYFNSKEEMLFKLLDATMDEALEVLEEICARRIPATEKLTQVLGFYVRYYAGDQARLHLLLSERHVLSPRSQRILITKERRYVGLFRQIFEELAAEGRTKAIPPSVATFAFLGMVHYTVKWYRRNGPVGLDRLAEFFVEIFTRGILRQADPLRSPRIETGDDELL